MYLESQSKNRGREILVLTLIEFFCPPPCCVATIDLMQTENKEVKKCENNTVPILNRTALGDGITLTCYYSSSDSKEKMTL